MSSGSLVGTLEAAGSWAAGNGEHLGVSSWRSGAASTDVNNRYCYPGSTVVRLMLVGCSSLTRVLASCTSLQYMKLCQTRDLNSCVLFFPVRSALPPLWAPTCRFN